MELVEGPTLADRIAQGPIPLDEALPIAKQIAEALEAAHEAGVIHRDLKPANIKVREDGTVKVLDFGLAKALDTTPAGDPSQSPTLTAAATQMGVILGTAAYMSPEQARGEPVDRRSDIWAFGVVLYEMLRGQRPFDGRTISDTLASVLARQPDLDALPRNIPPAVRRLLRRCFEKDQRRRLRNVAEGVIQLDEGLSGSPDEIALSSPLPTGTSWQRTGPLLIATFFLASLITAVAMWALLTAPAGRALPSPRVTLTLPESETLPGGLGGLLALSPDGQTLVYGALRDGVHQLFRRAIDQFDAIPIANTVGGREPFFSSDGRWLAFRVGQSLRKVPLTGGPAQTLAELPEPHRGGSWGLDDTIVLGGRASGLLQLPAAGGDVVAVSTPENGDAYWFPDILPDGKTILFTATPSGLEEAVLQVLIPDTGERRPLLAGAAGQYLPSGHLVFVRSQALWAVQFDPDRLEIIGTPVPVIDEIRVEAGGAVQFTVADDGMLAYIPSGGAVTGSWLIHVGREGQEEGTAIALPPSGRYEMGLSPDETRVAVSLGPTNSEDVWVADLTRGTLTLLTTHPANDRGPVWSPDSQRVAFTSDRNGTPELSWKTADGSGTAESLAVFGEPVVEVRAYDWLSDGSAILVERWTPSFGQLSGQVKVDSRFMFLSRFRLR